MTTNEQRHPATGAHIINSDHDADNDNNNLNTSNNTNSTVFIATVVYDHTLGTPLCRADRCGYAVSECDLRRHLKNVHRLGAGDVAMLFDNVRRQKDSCAGASFNNALRTKYMATTDTGAELPREPLPQHPRLRVTPAWYCPACGELFARYDSASAPTHDCGGECTRDGKQVSVSPATAAGSGTDEAAVTAACEPAVPPADAATTTAATTTTAAGAGATITAADIAAADIAAADIAADITQQKSLHPPPAPTTLDAPRAKCVKVFAQSVYGGNNTRLFRVVKTAPPSAAFPIILRIRDAGDGDKNNPDNAAPDARPTHPTDAPDNGANSRDEEETVAHMLGLAGNADVARDDTTFHDARHMSSVDPIHAVLETEALLSDHGLDMQTAARLTAAANEPEHSFLRAMLDAYVAQSRAAGNDNNTYIKMQTIVGSRVKMNLGPRTIAAYTSRATSLVAFIVNACRGGPSGGNGDHDGGDGDGHSDGTAATAAVSNLFTDAQKKSCAALCAMRHKRNTHPATWPDSELAAAMNALDTLLQDALITTARPHNMQLPLYIAARSVERAGDPATGKRTYAQHRRGQSARATRAGAPTAARTNSSSSSSSSLCYMLHSKQITHIMIPILYLTRCFAVRYVYLRKPDVTRGDAATGLSTALSPPQPPPVGMSNRAARSPADGRRGSAGNNTRGARAVPDSIDSRWASIRNQTAPGKENGIRYTRYALTTANHINESLPNNQDRFNVCPDHALCAYHMLLGLVRGRPCPLHPSADAGTAAAFRTREANTGNGDKSAAGLSTPNQRTTVTRPRQSSPGHVPHAARTVTPVDLEMVQPDHKALGGQLSVVQEKLDTLIATLCATPRIPGQAPAPSRPSQPPRVQPAQQLHQRVREPASSPVRNTPLSPLNYDIPVASTEASPRAARADQSHHAAPSAPIDTGILNTPEHVRRNSDVDLDALQPRRVLNFSPTPPPQSAPIDRADAPAADANIPIDIAGDDDDEDENDDEHDSNNNVFHVCSDGEGNGDGGGDGGGDGNSDGNGGGNGDENSNGDGDGDGDRDGDNCIYTAQPEPRPYPRHAFKPAQLLRALRTATNNNEAIFKTRAQRVEVEHALALGGRDRIVVQPTGFGKSLLYMIPAILKPNKVTIVLCPLVALIDDIKRRLSAASVDFALFKDRGTTSANLIITSVEATTTPSYNNFVVTQTLRGKLHAIVLEEGHLALTSAHFRPCMATLHRNIRPPIARKPPILMLTATCPPRLTDKILTFAGLRRDFVDISRHTTNRPNIAYIWLQPDYSVADHAMLIVEKLVTIAEEATEAHDIASHKFIVFTPTQNDCETICAKIECVARLNRLPIMTQFYHSVVPDDEKERRQSRWIAHDETTMHVMCATSGFGCGINCPTVRAVFHTEVPATMTDYAQESGRAGRDGRAAYSIVLASKNDQQWRSRNLNTRHPQVPYNTQPDPVNDVRDFSPCKTPSNNDKRCRRHALTAYVDGENNAVWCISAPDSMYCDVCVREPRSTPSDLNLVPSKAILSLRPVHNRYENPDSYNVYDDGGLGLGDATATTPLAAITQPLDATDFDAHRLIAIANFYNTACAPCSLRRRTLLRHDNGDNAQTSCFSRRCFTCASISHSHRNCPVANMGRRRDGTCSNCNLGTHNGQTVHPSGTLGQKACPFRNALRHAMNAWQDPFVKAHMQRAITPLCIADTDEDFLDYVINLTPFGVSKNRRTCGLAAVLAYLDKYVYTNPL